MGRWEQEQVRRGPAKGAARRNLSWWLHWEREVVVVEKSRGSEQDFTKKAETCRTLVVWEAARR